MKEKPWKVIFSDEAMDDIRSLDGSQREEVFRSIKKVSQNPLPCTEGGYGKPLGNKNGSNLTGCFKIKLRRLGIRVVYLLRRTERGMEILVVGLRSDAEVYEAASKRIKSKNKKCEQKKVKGKKKGDALW